MKYSDNELDNALWMECMKDDRSKEKVLELLAKGANINARWDGGETILSCLMMDVNNPEFSDYLNPPTCEIGFIKFLLDNGADPNILTCDGFNCLFDASLTWNPEIVELLLKYGANPNCVSSDSVESILDWVSGDQYYEENMNVRGGGKPLARIVEILEQYGAKTLREIFTDKIEEYVNVQANSETGLITLRGNIRIEQVKGANENLIAEFNKWIASSPVVYVSGSGYVLRDPDADNHSLLATHYKRGLSISQKLKKLVGNDIKVIYFYDDPSDYNSVKHISIDNKKR